MKKIIFICVALMQTTILLSQKLALNVNKPLNDIDKIKLTNENQLLSSNFLTKELSNIKTYSSNKPAREFFRKESLKKGAFKTGTTYGSTSAFISEAEVLLFNSEVINASVPLFKSTNTPFIAYDMEYNLTDDIAFGVLAGYTKSKTSNRTSDGVNFKSDTNGYIFGGYATFYRPLTSWLYLPMYAEFIYEKGKLDATNGLEIEKYEYVRSRPSIGFGLTLVFAEYIQVDLRGIDIAYSQVEFVQTQKIDTNTNEIQRVDQAIKNSKLELGTNPRIRVMFNVFNFAGGSNR